MRIISPTSFVKYYDTHVYGWSCGHSARGNQDRATILFVVEDDAAAGDHNSVSLTVVSKTNTNRLTARSGALKTSRGFLRLGDRMKVEHLQLRLGSTEV